ncbi:MAG: TIGR04219 family outer membrane beta-barrel protein [Campylobacterales bacterium]|nr:TIGR04219 family outer membrane beta-barrel protein [Campylobacterales bacterium]
MKKLILSLIVSVAFVQADFVRAEVGGGIWSHSVSGTLGNNPHVDLDKNMGIDAAKPLYLWGFIKHPLPLIPNIRLEYLNLSETSEQPKHELSCEQIDLLLYYNLLDNLLWLTWDVGAGVKQVRNKYIFVGTSEQERSLLPLLYTRIRAEVPASGFSVEGEIHYSNLDQNKLTDGRIKIDYTFDLIPMVQPALEIGYRVQHLTLKDGYLNSMDIQSDWTFSGPYIGAMLRF